MLCQAFAEAMAAKLMLGTVLFPAALELASIRTSFKSPWQNGVAERWVGSCRRDLLNHVIALMNVTCDDFLPSTCLITTMTGLIWACRKKLQIRERQRTSSEAKASCRCRGWEVCITAMIWLPKFPTFRDTRL